MSRYVQWLCLGIILLASPSIALAQSPLEADTRFSAVTTNPPALAPRPNDSRFVVSEGGDLDQYLFRSDRPQGLKFNIPITRYYFNPQNPPQFDSLGFMQPTDLADLLQRHVLPPTATLRLHVFDVDNTALHCPEIDYLYLNNQRLTHNNAPVTLSGVNGNWSTVSFVIPIGMLKLPQTVGVNAGPPRAVDNEIKLDSDWLCENKWAVQVAWASLEIPSPMRPVVFAHGWTGDVTTFKEFMEFARLDRLPTAPPPDLLRGVKPIAETAPILAQAISQARQQFGVDKVNIFAHSKGGLVARQALRSWDMAQQVDYLVSFGSPHHGSDLIPTWFSCNVLPSELKGDCRRASEELSVAAIRDSFNYRDCQYQLLPYPHWTNCQPRFVEQGRVQYLSLVGGTLDVGERTATYPWLADSPPYPRTGQVEARFFWRTHLDIHKSRQTYECAISFIAPAIYQRAGCLSEATAADLPQTPQWPSELAQAGAIITGQLTAPQVITLPITQTQTLWVNLFTSAALQEVQLLDPTGQPARIPATSQPHELGWWYQYQLDAPINGLWSLRLNSPDPIDYQVQLFYESTLQLFLTTARYQYAPHTLVTATAALFQQDQPLAAVPVTLTLIHPDNSQTHLPMHETQSLYTAEFDSTLMAGRHQLVAVAALPGGERQATTFIEVSDNAAQIEAITAETAQDTDQNGLYDRFIFTVTLQVQEAGPYEVSGTLLNDQGEAVASASYNASLQPGTQAIPLSFPSSLMTRALTLSQVSVQRAAVFVTEATEVYPSPSYPPDQMEGEWVQFGDISDTFLAETNQLGVTLTFTVMASGDYLVTGRLMDSQGQEIGWSQAQGQTQAVPTQTVTLTFDGATIQQHGQAGPFSLQDITILNQTHQRQTILGQIYTTTAYPLETFAAAPSQDYLSGQLRLQGRTNYYGVQVSLSLEPCDQPADPQTTLVRLTDSFGNYNLPLDPQKSYGCLRVRQKSYLAATHSRAQGGDVREVTLIAGDVNQDQRIDIFDLAYLSQHYNKTDPIADVNGDGLVNIFDLSLVAGNYQQRGPQSW